MDCKVIIIRLEKKPGPLRKFDWEARFEHIPNMIGYGDTMRKAVNNLFDQLEDA